MSKWINKDKFKNFVKTKKDEKNKEKEQEEKVGGGFYLKWKNPVMGTQEVPKIYRTRLLPDKNGDFYLKYFYHFFYIGEKAYYIKCEKTHGMDNFCPWCSVNQSLWKGNKNDKQKAYKYKRNQRFVANNFIIEDPRDNDADDEYKVGKSLRLYEFPPTIETKILNELTDDDEGYGSAIFDPENGHDFLIKILAKKPDEKGKVWPDYSLTQFSKKKTAIADTEEGIKEIMDSVYNLTEYINSMSLSWEEHEKLLKKELVWDEIEDEFIEKTGISSKKEESSNDTETKTEESSNDTETKTEESSNDGEELSEEDLMKELEDI